MQNKKRSKKELQQAPEAAAVGALLVQGLSAAACHVAKQVIFIGNCSKHPNKHPFALRLST